jgi:hypothetical protein
VIRIHSTFAAFLLSTSVLAAVPALAASVSCAACLCPPAKPVAHRATHASARKVVRADRAYATAFYDYRAAAPVSRSFHAAWVEAPHDRRIVFVNSYPPPAPLPPAPPRPAYDDAYGYGGGYAAMDYNPDLNRGWSGGVGYMGAQDGGGGGGGTAIIAGGQNQNGPTYNSYGQSFPYGGADTYAAQTNATWRNTGIPIKSN